MRRCQSAARCRSQYQEFFSIFLGQCSIMPYGRLAWLTRNWPVSEISNQKLYHRPEGCLPQFPRCRSVQLRQNSPRSKLPWYICAYDFKYVEAEWTTTVAGYDGYNHFGKRAYGSYLLLTSPFKAGWFDFAAQLGIVPYYCSRYSEDGSRGFHVNMCALKMLHTFRIERAKMQIMPYAQLMVNPSALTAHMSIGTRISFNP